MAVKSKTESVPPASEDAGGTPPTLAINGASKHYGGVFALDSVDFHVQPGEIVALLGENGAGKSTLVGIAAGRVVPDAGNVWVCGRDVTGATPAEVSAAGVRLVPQELLSCLDMSVIDNVLLGQHPTRWGAFIDKAAAQIEAKKRLELLGVGDIDLRAPVGSLPVVDQAFVQIARGLGDGARVFLLDEPTAPMDDGEVTRFLKVLKTAAAAGASIVYISHRLDEVFRLADRIVVLRDGHLAGEFATANTNVRQVVAAMVGGRSLIQGDHVTKAPSTHIALDVRGIQGHLVGDFSLRLTEGELCCIYGISGSGREQIGGLISGAVGRKSGQVVLKGREIPSGGIATAIRMGLGYVPAERRSQGLMIEASVAANLTLSILQKMSKWGFLSPSAPSHRALHWIKNLRIKARSPEAPVGSLSGGSQQKVLLARWLAADSDVLVLEEPTRGVDIATKSEIYELMRSLASRRKSVLVVTSDIEEAALIGERVIVLQGGNIVAELTKPTQEEIALAAHVKKGSGVRNGAHLEK